MKKGISPLIATVLLIGTTIVIAAIVSTFIINQTKKFEPEKFMGESSYCQDVVLGTKIIGDIMQCDDINPDCKKMLNFILANKGLFTVTKIDIKAEGPDMGTGTIDIATIAGKGLKPGRVLCTRRADCPNVDDIALEEFRCSGQQCAFYPGVCKGKSVRILPHITVDDKDIACTQSEMIINAENSGCF